jgi:hypothetical protein
MNFAPPPNPPDAAPDPRTRAERARDAMPPDAYAPLLAAALALPA